MKNLPPMERNCPTCPFLAKGYTQVRDLLIERATYITPICHSTGDSDIDRDKPKLCAEPRACRGARNLQLKLMHDIGFLEEPTDACWQAKVDECNQEIVSTIPMLPADLLIPKHLQLRPTFRGMPIPYIVHTDPDGFPNFRVMDEAKTTDIIRRRLCAICGVPLGKALFFLGGELCVTNRLFTDPHMHLDCALFSYRICPFMIGKTDYLLAEALAARNKIAVDESLAIDPHASTERPKRFYLLKATGIQLKEFGGSMYIKAEPVLGAVPLPNPDERDYNQPTFDDIRAAMNDL